MDLSFGPQVLNETPTLVVTIALGFVYSMYCTEEPLGKCMFLLPAVALTPCLCDLLP